MPLVVSCRFLEPPARAARLRGVAPLSFGGSDDACASQPDDDVVLLLERARDSKSTTLRAEVLHK
jgi:hypothetical protein